MADAQEACEKEDAQLAHIPNKDAQDGLKALIEEKKVRYSFFTSSLQYWLGAQVSVDMTSDFEWANYEIPMKNYNNWKSNKMGKILAIME